MSLRVSNSCSAELYVECDDTIYYCVREAVHDQHRDAYGHTWLRQYEWVHALVDGMEPQMWKGRQSSDGASVARFNVAVR